MSDTQSTGLLVCDDFLFTSKVTGTARTLGLRMVEVNSQAAASRALSDDPPRVVVIDLNFAGLDLPALMSELPEERRPTVIAFDSHVNTERIQAARDAGCDEVLPRSRFSAELPTLLGRFV